MESSQVRWRAAYRIRSRQRLSAALLGDEAERVDMAIVSGVMRWRAFVRIRSRQSLRSRQHLSTALLDEDAKHVDLAISIGLVRWRMSPQHELQKVDGQGATPCD